MLGLAASLLVVIAAAGCANRGAPTASATGPAATDRPAVAGAPAGSAAALVTPELSREWQAYRQSVARQVLAASPGVTYTGPAQLPALAVPVFEIELAADGSIVRIDLVRAPRQAPETTQIVIDALRRAEPFGPVTHLPRPWRFAEGYIFNGKRHFKPMSLEP